MGTKIKKLLEFLKSKKVGVFCDDSNLYKSYQKYGWRVDFSKFKKLLENHCDLQFINYYIAIPNKSDAVFDGTKRFLEKIRPYVTVKEKKLKYTPVAGKFMKKADVDVEIVLDVMRYIDALDVVIILSGDSDLLELKNYVVKEKGKNIIFCAFEKNMAWELKYCWHLYLDDFKKEIGMDLRF
ncbi:MAG: NYN domain-containing protein [Patescibacteria group bacterium]|nr:NYN domain-containing protein [Patescibacteria group bacterium]